MIPNPLSPSNKKSLDQIIRRIRFSEGQFSLILAHCSYVGLREQILGHLRAAAEIREIRLPESVTTLYTFIRDDLRDEMPNALMILGLESAIAIDKVLIAANHVREDFRRHFPFPIILWVNDDILYKLVRLVPDFKSWAGASLHFELSDDALADTLQGNADHLFHQILNLPPFLKGGRGGFLLPRRELSTFLKDAESCQLDLTPELNAAFQFLKGRNAQHEERTDTAISHYQSSLSFWTNHEPREREGVLLQAIAKCYEQQNDLENARSFFQACIKAFENRHELAAKCACEQCRVLYKSGNWDELRQLAEQSLQSNQACGNDAECAECYRFLAEVALHDNDWEKAVKLAQNALETPSSEARDMARLLLSKAYQEGGQLENATRPLEQAKSQGAFEDNPRLYVEIMEGLRVLYFEQEQFLEAFEVKQEKLSVEQQFGFRAFIGAGCLKARRSKGRKQTDVSLEIQASGRQLDVNRLMERISRTDYKLIVLHGVSGVGKSSMLEAGLVPALRQKIIDGRDVLPVLLTSYTNWDENLWQKLPTTSPPQEGGAGGGTPLKKIFLQKTSSPNSRKTPSRTF